MEIYYEKQRFIAKFLRFIGKLLLLIAILVFLYVLLLHLNVVSYYRSYSLYIIIGAWILLVLGFIFLILAAKANKRKNIRFDGTIIKFCFGREVEHEFNIKNIDEMFNYRLNKDIPFGFSDSLAFRFHKNEVWESISSKFYTKKGNSSLILINDINSVYANLKLNRSIKEIDDTQGVRFAYLSLKDEKDVDHQLKNFEKTITQYGNTYGSFENERVVVTIDSIYYNKKNMASTLKKDYIRIKKHEGNHAQYHQNDIIEFYNSNDELIKAFDTTLMINGLYFKLLVKTIFEEKKDYMDTNNLEKVVSEDNIDLDNKEEKSTNEIIIDNNENISDEIKVDNKEDQVIDEIDTTKLVSDDINNNEMLDKALAKDDDSIEIIDLNDKDKEV
ncbi:MAG: hypothetical protein LBR40_02605 [Bacilli bacterium]|jgi:hypothetical protein|nr:hypothetical protein [Bacilli bacterium]